jgi:copper transport protein
MVGKCAAIVLMAVALLISTPLRAAAHAELLNSQPLGGERLGLAPSAVVLVFSEPLSPALSEATVFDPSGRAVTRSPSSAFDIRVSLLTNLPGLYRVTWEAVSAADGHTTDGSFTFTVEALSSPIGPKISSGRTPLDIMVAIARWIEDAALLLIVGMLFVVWLARRESRLSWVRPRLLAPMFAALIAGLVVIGGEAIAAAGVSVGGLVTYLTSGPAGAARVARVCVEAVGCVAIATRTRALLPAVPIALAALSASSHAAGGAVPWVSVAVDTGHLLAAGVWVGGIMAMATLRPPGGWHADGRVLLARFTPWALLGFATSVGLGVIQAVTNVGDASALLTTAYGRLLVIKAAGVTAIVPLSVLAWRHRRVHLRAEAAIGIVVVAAGALLASYPVPARTDTASPPATPVVVAALPRGDEFTLGGQAGQTLVGLTLDPAIPGMNQVTVYVANDGVSPAQRLDVTALLNGHNLPLHVCGDSCRHARVALVGGEAISLRVTGAQGGEADFRLPALPAPDGSTLLRTALAGMGRLHSVTLHETLTGGAGTTIVTDYEEVAPDMLEWTQPGGSAAVVIGAIRYTRAQGRDLWTEETGNPTVSEPAFSWELFSPDVGVHVLGSAKIGAIPTTEIAFFAGAAATPVWFRFYVDDHGLVRRAEMAAPGHFMTQTFADFNAPLNVERPAVG